MPIVKEDNKSKVESDESDSTDSSDESDDDSSEKSSNSSSSGDESDKKPNDDKEEEELQSGRTKNLASFFATQTDNTKAIRRKRIEVDTNPDTIVLENEPERLEGVIRADDQTEWQKPIEVEKGHAKNIASMWQNRKEEPAKPKPRFKIEMQKAGAGIFENEPVVLEGVVRSSQRTEEVATKKGRIKDMVGRFANVSDDDSDSDDAEARARQRRRRSEVVSKPTGAVILAENIPAEADPNVARYGDSNRDEPVVESGRIRNIAGMWQQTCDSSTPTPKSAGTESGKPSWKVELDRAKEYGVFENEPEVRDDVVRADDENPDVISVQHTRSVRKMWSQIEQDEMKGKEPTKSVLVRKKKKESTPEPEPEPVPEPKKKKVPTATLR